MGRRQFGRLLSVQTVHMPSGRSHHFPYAWSSPSQVCSGEFGSSHREMFYFSSCTSRGSPLVLWMQRARRVASRARFLLSMWIAVVFQPRFCLAVGLTCDSGLLLVSPMFWVDVVLPRFLDAVESLISFFHFRLCMCFLLPFLDYVFPLAHRLKVVLPHFSVGVTFFSVCIKELCVWVLRCWTTANFHIRWLSFPMSMLGVLPLCWDCVKLPSFSLCVGLSICPGFGLLPGC